MVPVLRVQAHMQVLLDMKQHMLNKLLLLGEMIFDWKTVQG